MSTPAPPAGPGTLAPPVNADNVNVGVASMYVQPWARSITPELPPDDTDLGVVWPTPWVPLGATDTGLEFQFTRKTDQITIEEWIVEVDEATKSLTFGMSADLAEDTLQTMKLAYGGGKIVETAATTSSIGKRTLQISSAMQPFVFGFEVENELGYWRRYLIPKVKSVADVKTKFALSKDKRMYSTTFNSLCRPEDCTVVEKIAEKTG